MNQEDFEVIVRNTIVSIKQLLSEKGAEYSCDWDRLSNFKRGAVRTGCTPLQVLWVYLAKHVDAVETFVQDDAAGKSRIRSEPIEGRLDDIINYCLLAKAVIKECSPSQIVMTAPGKNTEKQDTMAAKDGR